MPNFELHADYDKDGIVSMSAQEYSLRSSRYGAILVPNLDIENRRLPTRPSAGPLRNRDFINNRSIRNDDDRYNIIIKVTQPLQANTDIFLRCSRFVAERIILFDAQGHVVARRPGFNDCFILPQLNQAGNYHFKIIVRSIPGGAFDRITTLSLNYTAGRVNESLFNLEIVSFGRGARMVIHDIGKFSIAPFLLMDSILPVKKLYITRSDWNTATLTEVRALSRAWGIPLIEVPSRMTDHDIWHQDQYQHSFIQGAQNNTQELILHLPRMRMNTFSFSARQQNLASFVNNYFASDDIGLFTELWTRNFEVQSTTGRTELLNFLETNNLINNLELVDDLLDLINDWGDEASAAWQEISYTSWYDRRVNLRRCIQRLVTTMNASLRMRRSRVRNIRDTIDQKEIEINRYSRYTIGAGLSININNTWVPLSRATTTSLFAKIDQLHDSANYGGNIESTPPITGAPLGKIIIGNITRPNGAEFVDRDLLKILAFQRKQPIVEINTTWLRVGHVDEVISVVPVMPGDTHFSFFNASPRVAMTLLQKAATKYISGLPANHILQTRPERFYRTTLDSRLMMAGNHPVTRMFRGHAWYQDESIEDLPKAFVHLAFEYQGINAHNGIPLADNASNIGINIENGRGLYPADISVLDMMHAEKDRNNQSCNQFIDRTFVQNVRNQINGQFTGKKIFEIPVLFDRVRSTQAWGRNHDSFQVSSISPDMANLQYVNGKLLIPRPYGPRMRYQDAIEIIRETLREFNMPETVARVSRNLIARYQLNRGIYWVEKCNPISWNVNGTRFTYGGIKNQADVIQLFKDSFPGATPRQLQQHIINPNSRSFNGAGILRQNINRFVIVDEMVDLFELFTIAVCEQANVQPHFVDTWYYHVLEGQVHCGTNVLRDTRRAHRLPKFWNTPDVVFR